MNRSRALHIHTQDQRVRAQARHVRGRGRCSMRGDRAAWPLGAAAIERAAERSVALDLGLLGMEFGDRSEVRGLPVNGVNGGVNGVKGAVHTFFRCWFSHLRRV